MIILLIINKIVFNYLEYNIEVEEEFGKIDEVLIKVRNSLSWLSSYIKHIDFQDVSMTTKGKTGRHWLSGKCRHDNQ